MFVVFFFFWFHFVDWRRKLKRSLEAFFEIKKEEEGLALDPVIREDDKGKSILND